ncbi:hypothetical protein [Polaribacter porphyrae]|uniref:Lipoprotein n=1 Tax=Polaribacter porphyrae TaxID=1137780 RepID=A0A2S7WN29_9FLAO|nr:hypothetical protein [Polaribacter porphyrae]PQJ78989.1 hypothetical protein BTO18_07280 [Polaribacter porphyrae]
MKTIKRFLIIAIIAISAIFTGCESRDSDMILPENPIFQNYFVKYNLTTKQTEAKATFRTIDKTGTRLVLKGKSSIMLNGKKQDAFSTAVIDGYFYSWKNQKGLLNAKFTYVKNGTKKFNNTFSSKDISNIEFKSGHDKLELKKDNTIIWKGNPIKAGEEVYVIVYQRGKTSAIPSTSKIGATSITIKKEDLKDLKAGKAKIHLTRKLTKNTIKEEDGKAGGSVTLENLVVAYTILK